MGFPKLILKRFVFSVKLKRICKERGLKLCKNGVFWWTGRNKSGKYNFTVKSQNKSFCVKLVGVRSKRILFGFVDEKSYEIKDYTFALLHTMDSFVYELKEKEPYRFENDHIPVIVMIPESGKVTVRRKDRKNDRTEISSRDKTPEGEFYFGKDFLEMLKFI